MFDWVTNAIKFQRARVLVGKNGSEQELKDAYRQLGGFVKEEPIVAPLNEEPVVPKKEVAKKVAKKVTKKATKKVAKKIIKSKKK